MPYSEDEWLRTAARLVADPKEMEEFNQGVIREFRAHQGKVGGRWEDMPVLLLTMTGARTGRTLTRPLTYTRDGDRIVIVASYGGAPHNPPWYHNLVANPVATVELGTETFRVRASVTSGAERQRLFDHQAGRASIGWRRTKRICCKPSPCLDGSSHCP